VKVFLEPTGLHSFAMKRVAKALAHYAPPSVQIVDRFPNEADLRVLHVIGPGVYDDMDPNQPHAIIQYCLESAGYDRVKWSLIWQRAKLVWSYFDLTERGGGELFDFYHAPLGIDRIFAACHPNGSRRDIGAMSSGYVSHPAAEAIEEVAIAGANVGIQIVHLGPDRVEGMATRPRGWVSLLGISDEELRDLYTRTEWVSGLRHVEGFELPVIEGLACGARPFVFDRPDMRMWYEGHAVFVPECHGEELTEELTQLLRHQPAPVSEAERQKVLDTFNWERIATGFWERLL
jgi:glycosyltransferase involved in cell wall biosynthesis